jgi:hypothetical protein
VQPTHVAPCYEENYGGDEHHIDRLFTDASEFLASNKGIPSSPCDLVVAPSWLKETPPEKGAWTRKDAGDFTVPASPIP